MKFGRFDVSLVIFGSFRLDGGAMFGSVPKNLWATRIPCDAENCIPLVTRSLLIKADGRTILVDVGMGEKWSEKSRQIYAIKNAPKETLPFKPEEITDIILTHLHFDHAGGVSRAVGTSQTEVELCYPQAAHYLQKANWEFAQKPSLKERASYLPENVLPLKNARLQLVDGSTEIFPDLWVHRLDGHTFGQQWIELKDGTRSIVYPTDLIPTSRHLPVPFHMGYDACATTVLKEKEEFLSNVLATDSIVVFEHDPDTHAVTVGKDAKGHFCVKDHVSF